MDCSTSFRRITTTHHTVMASISSLLNPEPEGLFKRRYQQIPSRRPSPDRERDQISSPLPRQKKQKICKDAAVFTKGKPRGEVRFPPCEYQDPDLAAAHRKFRIHPMGNIMDYPRHIPYNSEKKPLLRKTGRESFEGNVLLIHTLVTS